LFGLIKGKYNISLTNLKIHFSLANFP